MNFRVSKDSSLPLHRQLLNELRHAILSGKLKPHERLPGEIELAEQLGISRETVRRAWQSAQEEDLIYKVPGKGTYVSEPQPTQSTMMVVGFLIPEFRSTFDSHLLSGAEGVLRKHGYRLLFAHTDRKVSEENRLLAEMCSEGAVGFLIWPAMGDAKGRFLAEPQNCSVPAVLMDRPIPGLALPCVSSRNYMGGRLAVEHLLELGHRRIAFLARPHLELWPVAERLRAYQDAMREAGVEPLPPLLIGAPRELSAYEAYTQINTDEISRIAEILKRPDRPTAIFAMNDWMALKALHAAERVGLRVPDDLSLVGFDNLELAEHLDPPLTTVAQDPMMIGAEAARRLVALINGESVGDVMTLIPTRLVVRASTAPPPE